MAYNSLPEHVQVLEHTARLKRTTHPAGVEFEAAQLADRVMSGGPALLFESGVAKRISAWINAGFRQAHGFGALRMPVRRTNVTASTRPAPPRTYGD